ncbi:hypothetical protein [Amycolatopsis lurida]|uniref:hypothetical protein n=1 Tax=Amycolatopsis lurida TaxID=31959 RepID=UPI00115FA92F|nr:hypothetical protein [Amycolatopsis lurida]
MVLLKDPDARFVGFVVARAGFRWFLAEVRRDVIGILLPAAACTGGRAAGIGGAAVLEVEPGGALRLTLAGL